MVDASNGRVWGDGAVFKGAYGATAPTGPSGAPAGFDDLGAVSEDGIEATIPDSGDSNAIRMWQGRAQVRVIRTPTDDLATYVFTLLETKKEVIETYFGVSVNDSDGSFEYTAGALRSPDAYIFDYIDGSQLRRDHLPRGVVTSVGSQTFASDDVTGYQVTVEAEYDPDSGYDIKSWLTALVVTP